MQKTSILQGDALETLRGLPPESVQCCVTSPPYWGLRDYGVEGQIGLEPTPEEYIEKLVEVFREVRRVLRDDGTCWVNMGDSYVHNRLTSPMKGDYSGKDSLYQRRADYIGGKMPKRVGNGLKIKDLCGMPWRLVFALQQDGWYLRSDIIWAKPNPMPEGVTDRPTKSHEYVFLLTKNAKYFWDQEAVRESYDGLMYQGGAGRGENRDRNDGGKCCGMSNPSGRNIRTVWTIPTQPFKKAHFATFPEKLVEPMIKAGTSEMGCCPECGGAWERVVELSKDYQKQLGNWSGRDKSGKGVLLPTLETGAIKSGWRGSKVTITTGFQPSCSCPEAKPIPCTVLDPFAGAFTVGVVAWRLGRSFIGIELSPEYVKIGKERLYSKASLFHQELGGEKK